ncbi:MAG: hypothetical protein NW224_22305 [Leptolyngbyaceae cyanobacterium bins.302]|nr:hypothetical protein [Leptolyngbyaceae cyanobacterium bins.302]
MEILAVLTFTGILWGVFESMKKPAKTPEQEFGEAITKYLSKG